MLLRTFLLGIIGIKALVAAAPPSLPVVFEPNAGRFDRTVKFSARTRDYRVLFGQSGAVFHAFHPAPGKPHSLTISPVGGNPKPEILGESELPFRTSYFLGRNSAEWRPNVANYARVRYRAVYPGIDLVYYGAGRELEYDFIVQPGADPSRIRLRFDGVRGMSIDPEGNLVVETAGSKHVQRRPVLYQEVAGQKREAPGRFRLAGKNVVRFEVGPYDRSRPLIIDPVITYASLLGGAASDLIVGTAVNSDGIVYVAGQAIGSDIPVSEASFQQEHGGLTDIFVAMINPAIEGPGALLYFTYIGGGAIDKPTAVKLDAKGNLYLTGSTTSNNFPLAGSGLSATIGANPDPSIVIQQPDAFVMKLGPGDNGPLDLLYSRYLGGSDADIGVAIDLDADGYIYIAGTTRSENFPVTDNNFQPVRWSNSDAFVTKVHPDFAPHLFYSTFVGGGDIDEGRGIAVSPRTGLIYVAGATYSSDFFPLGQAPWRPSGLGRGDIFVFQMDLSKPGGEAITNGTFLTGSDLEDVNKLILDSQDRVLLTGYTVSRDFPVTPGALQTQIAGIANVFVTRLDFSKQGSDVLSYSTYLGGRDGDVGYDIALDEEGAAYVTGYTVSPDFPVTQDAIQPFSGGGIEAFLTKFAFNDGDAPGGLHYSTYIGRGGVHTANGLVVTPDGVAYIVGQTSESHVPVTEGSYQTSFGGGPSDGFLLIINSRASQP